MKILRKIKRFFRYITTIIYYIFCKIKNIGKPKGVAQVINSFNSGGMEQVAANIYKMFLENGNASYVISVTNEAGPMCQQLESPKHFRMVYYDFCEMLRFCAKNNIGTLIYHFTTFKMPQFKILGFKNYYIVHNTYIWYTETEWKHLKTKLKFTNGIIAVSEWCKSYFCKKTGINNVKVILNGINFENLYTGNISSVNRENLKIKDNEIAILTVGSYTDGKHQMEIIGVAEQIIKKHKNVKFICAGPILNHELYDLFMKTLKKSPAKDNIIILHYIAQDEMGDFMRKNCDIYLQPSIHEAGVPLTVMEALMNKKPVVMTDFMLSKTFPVIDRIKGVRPPYEDIMEITPKIASDMAKEKIDASTEDFVKALEEMIENVEYFKDEKNFKSEDYAFLDVKRMGKEYISFIKL